MGSYRKEVATSLIDWIVAWVVSPLPAILQKNQSDRNPIELNQLFTNVYYIYSLNGL
jgi:hypothetical protein